MARAQAVRPDFALTAETAPIIAEVASRLDGLPLAVELAAARVRLLQPRDLLARLDDRLRVLTGGPRDAPSRHQTLRQAIAWSHDFLTPEEQSLFRRLAVFAASTTLAAVEAVADPDGELDALDTLNSLVEGNLVQCTKVDGGEARYGMLQTIRAFGLEQLVASGEEAQFRAVHARYVGSVVTEARAALPGPEQGSWYDRFATEHDDIREALRWLISRKDAEPAVRLVGIIWAFWWIRGYLTEGGEWLERVLALGPTSDPEARALALFGAGTLAEARGDLSRAVARYDEALDLARTHGDDQGAARVEMALAALAQDQGEYGEAEQRYGEALRRFRTAGDEAGAAQALIGLGTLAAYRGENERAATHFIEGAKQFERLGDAWSLGLANGNLARLAFLAGDFDRATSHGEQALAIFQRLGDQANIALLLANLGEVAHRRGALDEAARLYDESLTLFRELGDKRNIASTLVTLAQVDVTRGELSRAATLLNESLILVAELEDKEGAARGLEAFAALAQAQGKREQAVQALGAATALREAIGMPLPLVYQPEHERLVEDARKALGLAFDQAWETGLALRSQDAVDAAIASTASMAMFRSLRDHLTPVAGVRRHSNS